MSFIKAGNYMRVARESAKMTQRELADAINVTPYTMIAQWEQGVGRMPLPLTHKAGKAMATALLTSVHDGPPEEYVKAMAAQWALTYNQMVDAAQQEQRGQS